MSSLLESIASAINPELTSPLAAHYGIAEEAAEGAVKTSAATILAALAAKAHDHDFLGSVYALVTTHEAMAAAAASHAAPVSSRITSAPSGFLHQLFGDRLEPVEASVAETSEVPLEAAGGMMTAAAPLVLDGLSRRVEAGGLSVGALAETLTAELPRLRGFLPDGFALPGLAMPVSSASHASAAHPPENSKVAAGWLWPVLLAGAVLIGCLIWFFNRSDANAAQVAASPQSAADVAAPLPQALDSAQPSAMLGAFTKHKLPNGTELNIPENGIENKLIAFIEDPSRPVEPPTWFDFDRLLFATGSPTLAPSSSEQLKNVAAILEAYPKVDIRIGGYSDNTGDAAANLKLSADRATNVMAELARLNVDPARMDARGYGAEHPIGDNTTTKGRAKNRRISLRVIEK